GVSDSVPGRNDDRREPRTECPREDVAATGQLVDARRDAALRTELRAALAGACVIAMGVAMLNDRRLVAAGDSIRQVRIGQRRNRRDGNACATPSREREQTLQGR